MLAKSPPKATEVIVFIIQGYIITRAILNYASEEEVRVSLLGFHMYHVIQTQLYYQATHCYEGVFTKPPSSKMACLMVYH